MFKLISQDAKDFLCECVIGGVLFSGSLAVCSGFFFVVVYFVTIILYLLGIEPPTELPNLFHIHTQ